MNNQETQRLYRSPFEGRTQREAPPGLGGQQLLAVYGRLRAEPRPLLADSPMKGTHYIEGWKLYEADDDAYAWPDPDSRITVTVYEVGSWLLEELDARADHPMRYKRITVPPGLWLYISAGSSIREYPEIPSGDWLEHLRAKEQDG